MKQLGNLLLRQIGYVEERQNGALPDCQELDGFEDLRPDREVVGSRRTVGRRGEKFLFTPESPSTPAHLIQSHSARPARRRPHRPYPAPSGQRSSKCLVSRVGGGVRIARRDRDHVQNTGVIVRIPAIETAEAAFVRLELLIVFEHRSPNSGHALLSHGDPILTGRCRELALNVRTDRTLDCNAKILGGTAHAGAPLNPAWSGTS